MSNVVVTIVSDTNIETIIVDIEKLDKNKETFKTIESAMNNIDGLAECSVDDWAPMPEACYDLIPGRIDKVVSIFLS